MTPVNIADVKPLDNLTERDRKMINELKEFVEAGCDCAQLWIDDKVTIQRNIAIYHRLCRKYGYRHIKFFQKNYKLYALMEVN